MCFYVSLTLDNLVFLPSFASPTHVFDWIEGKSIWAMFRQVNTQVAASFPLSHVYTEWTIVEIWDIRDKGHAQVTMSLLTCDMMWCLCTEVCFLCTVCMLVSCEYTICMWKCWWNSPKPSFSQLQWKLIAAGEQSSARPLLWHRSLCTPPEVCCCVCVCVRVLYVHLSMDICLCLQPGINSVGRVPTGESVEDDGCTRTSSAPPSVSAAAAAVEQGIPIRSCIQTHPRTTATAQSPPPGWGQTHTHSHTKTLQQWTWRLLDFFFFIFMPSLC